MKHNTAKHIHQNCKQVVMCLQLSDYLDKTVIHSVINFAIDKSCTT